jgi:hypothetical protein
MAFTDNSIAFLKSAGKLGVGGVIASCLLLTMSVVEHAKGQNVLCYTFVIFSCLLFMLGAYLAWSAEHKKVLDLTQLPKLSVEIMEVFIIPSARSDVFVLASVRNDSKYDTMISKYRVLVDADYQLPYLLEGPKNDLGKYCRRDVDWSQEPKNRVTGKYSLKDLSTLISRQHPLKGGLPEEGWLHFQVESGIELPSLTREMLKSLTLVLWDSSSKHAPHPTSKTAPLDNPFTLITQMVEVPS